MSFHIKVHVPCNVIQSAMLDFMCHSMSCHVISSHVNQEMDDVKVD
jgi:hypothetical protein